jgi:translocation protein SEC63
MKVRQPSLRLDVCSKTNVNADSLAGQMHQMKTGAPPKKRRPANDDSSGSDTEGDVESESETDTDTDSDDE